MKQYGYVWLLILLPLLIACSNDDEIIRLQLGALSQSWLPNYSSPKNYVNADGDTIQLSELRDATSTELIDVATSTTSNNVEFDEVELQSREMVIGSEERSLRFIFQLHTEHQTNSPRLSEDFFAFHMEDQHGRSNVRLEFEVTDSMRCVSADCHFTDSLVIRERGFSNVYFSPRNNPRPRALYLSRESGIAGFKLSNGRKYELIN